jgi:DNA-binding SARP family transcriptional activator/tetratricopeptide (TPR) repeat protein
MFDLRLLGGASVEGPDGVLTDLAPRHQELAILALLATTPGQITRDKLLAFLWPESDSRRARNSLNVAVHELRKTLGRESIVSINDDLRLNSEIVDSDIDRFRKAITAEEWEEAVASYTGPFLEGFHLRNGLDFEEWARIERERFARHYHTALETLAVEAEHGGDLTSAIRWWRRLAAEDPSSARVTVRLMLALEATGDRGRALDLAHAHTELLRDEFEADPDPDVEALAKRLREAPANGYNGVDQEIESHWRLFELPGRTTGSRWLGGLQFKRVTLLTAAIAAFLVLCTESVRYDNRRVVVVPFENRTGDSELDPLGLVATDWITQGLTGTGFVQPVSSSTVAQVVQRLEKNGDRSAVARAQSLAEEMGAGVLISGSYFRYDDSLVFQAQIVEMPSGEVLRTIDEVSAPIGAPQNAVEVLRQRAIGALATYYDSRLVSWAQAASQPPSYDAYQRFSVGLDRFFQGRRAESVELFHEAAALDRSFTAPLMWALFAHRYMGQWAEADSLIRSLEDVRDRLPPWDRAMLDYHAALQRGNHVGAYQAMKTVTRITPDSEWLYKLAIEALALNSPREAVDILTGLEPRGWLLTWPDYWSTFASAYHDLGDHEAELATIKRGQEHRPESAWLRWEEARAHVGLGNTEAAVQLVKESSIRKPWQFTYLFRLIMELRVHGYEDAAQQVVGLALPWFSAPSVDEESPMLHQSRGAFLYVAKRWDESKPHYEWLASPTTVDPDFRGRLAVLALREGDRETAIQTAEWMEGFGAQPYNHHGQYTLWRARLAAHLGDHEKAVGLLRQAFREGASADPGVLHIDPDLEPLWDYEPFQELLRPKG